MYHDTIAWQFGYLTAVVDETGAVTAVHMHVDETPPGEVGERNPAAVADVMRQLQEYLAGERRTFDVTLAPAGTPFQQRVWEALLTIPYGETISYGEQARRIGQPTASRAVGGANGRNPISIIVPCHRVIGASGKLTGYAGGVDRKDWLLAHERAVLAADD